MVGIFAGPKDLVGVLDGVRDNPTQQGWWIYPIPMQIHWQKCAGIDRQMMP